MGHTKFEDLSDLSDELNKVRTLIGLKENCPGIFYFKSKPFLHFHDKDGVRWADIRVNDEWLKLDIDFLATKKEKSKFMKKVLDYHNALINV
ncbi:MAG TPA: hypothetical protein VNJ01_13460 [Bacteriovoracaceae bacterium]|nr:hypothetical protein [Bacteriovoracaceae bacterium]